MDETNTPGDPGEQEPKKAAEPTATKPDSAEPIPSSKTRRRRRWPWIVGAVVALLLVLVLLVPTIASSGIGRSVVVSQVNQRINGHLQISDLSLGWTSGIRVDGLVITDASGRQILQLPHLSTELTLLNAIRGNYDLGTTQVNGLDVLVSREPDGNLNWADLVKSENGKAASAAPPPTSGTKSSAPTKMPSVRGEVIVRDCTITYEDRSPQQQPPIYLRSVQADVKIPNINEPITDSLSASAQIGSASAAPGTISVNGSLAAVKDNLLAIDSASIDQTVVVKGVNLAAVSTLLGPDLKLAGMTDGQVALKLTNGTDGAVQATLLSNQFAAGGNTLNGASLKSEAFSLQLPLTTFHLPQGISNATTATVLIGDGHTPLVAQLKEASIAQGQGASARQVLSGYTLTFTTAGSVASTAQGRDVKLTQLDLSDNQGLVSIKKAAEQDVAASLPASGNPAASGTINIAADLKRLNDAAQALQGTEVVAKDKNGTDLRSGRLDGRIVLAQATGQAIKLSGNFGLTQLTVGDATSTPVQNESIQLVFEALANHDLSQVDVPQLDATGDLLSAHGSGIRLKLANGSDPKSPPVPVLQMVQKADLVVKANDLSKLQRIGRAFSPPVPTTAPAPVPAGSPAAPPELPPADITGGSATITLHADSDGKTLTLTPGIVLGDLAFKRGKVQYNAGTINFTTEADIIPASGTLAPSAGLMDQIAELRLPKLDLKAPSVGNLEISLPEPILLRNPGGLSQLLSPPKRPASATPAASLTGRILMRGVPGPLLELVDALSGQTPPHKVEGGYAIDEQFTADPSGAIVAKGRADLNDLVVDGQINPEKAFRILSDLSLNSAAKTLDLKNLTVQATSTNGMNLVVAGKIVDLGGQQRIENALTLDLGYDLAPLWQVLLPLMSAEQQKSYKDVEVAGKFQKQFVLGGSYPAGKPFNQAVQSLTAHGDVQLSQFASKSLGIALDDAAIPVDLKDGQVRLAYFGKPEGQNLPPAMGCNNGKLNLGGTVADLRGEHILVTTPKDMKLMENVSLNPVLASRGLGDYLNNPVFVGAAEATGQLNLTVRNCDQLPIDSLGVPQGNAVLDLAIGSLQLGSPQLAKVIPKQAFSSLKGEVPAYHITIDKGTMKQDFTLVILNQKRPLHLTGDVNLATKQMGSTIIDLPWALFGVGDKSLQKYLPEGIQIPLKGQSNSPIPALDVNQLLQKSVGEAGQKYVQDRLLGGGKADDNTGTPTTQATPEEQGIKLLGNLLNKKKKKPQDGN